MFDLLIAEDTPAARKQLAKVFGQDLSGYRVHQAAHKAEALRLIAQVRPGLLLLDLVMPALEGAREFDASGREILTLVRNALPKTRVIVLTSQEHRAREYLIELGADDFFAKSELPGGGVRKLVGEVEALLPRLPCRSPGARAAWERLQTCSEEDRAFLVTGERGTGKRALARALHEHLAPPAASLCEISLADPSPASLGDVRQRLEGLGEATLLLADLEAAGGVPEALQNSLACLLSPSRFRGSVVGLSVLPPDRLGLAPGLAALFEGAVRIALPPLRERGEDLLELADILCRASARALRKPCRGLDSGARNALEGFHGEARWPANLGTLKRIITDAVKCATGERLTTADLSPCLRIP